MPITYESPKVIVRLEAEQFDQLKASAAASERTLPAHIRWIVKNYLDREAK